MSVVRLGLLFAMSAPFLAALWLARQRTRLAPALVDGPAERDGHDRETGSGSRAEILDPEPIVRAAAAAMHEHARALFVHVELAIFPGHSIRAEVTALRIALQASILTAIRATPGGQVLVTAAALEDQLHIRIMDDGVGTDPATRESLARDAEELIAPLGGGIAVERLGRDGSVVTISIPLAHGLAVAANRQNEGPDRTGRDAWTPGDPAGYGEPPVVMPARSLVASAPG